METSESAKPKKSRTLLKTVLISMVMVFTLLICNTAIWFNKYIFNTATFTETATTALLSESSRTAIATQVTERLLAERPVAKRVLDEVFVKIISALLDSSLTQTATEKSISFLHTAVTSNDPQEISYDLTGLKSVITRAAEVGGSITDTPAEERRINPEDIPNEIVLFDPAKLPNIYAYGVAIMWLGVVSFVLAIGVLIYLIYSNRKNKRSLYKILSLSGVVVLSTGVLAHLIGPLIKPTVMAQITTSNGRVVVSNLYEAFVSQFAAQTNILYVVGVLLLFAAAWFYLDINKIIRRRLIQNSEKETKAQTKTTKKHTKK